jgi:hypothetical protein
MQGRLDAACSAASSVRLDDAAAVAVARAQIERLTCACAAPPAPSDPPCACIARQRAAREAQAAAPPDLPAAAHRVAAAPPGAIDEWATAMPDAIRRMRANGAPGPSGTSPGAVKGALEASAAARVGAAALAVAGGGPKEVSAARAIAFRRTTEEGETKDRAVCILEPLHRATARTALRMDRAALAAVARDDFAFNRRDGVAVYLALAAHGLHDDQPPCVALVFDVQRSYDTLALDGDRGVLANLRAVGAPNLASVVARAAADRRIVIGAERTPTAVRCRATRRPPLSRPS